MGGPCVLESDETNLAIGTLLRDTCASLGLPYVFKASFDKANRSSIHSARGPGLEAGLAMLARMRDLLGVPVTTDFHEPEQAAPAAEAVDLLQIPAFLCRQTDLLVAAGRTGRVVNIKKGQFVSPYDIRLAAEKVASTGNSKVILTERGSTFGYNNLVVDMRGLPVMRKRWPVVFDATHSVQMPGAAGAMSGGQPEFIEPLARAAIATGIDGLFVEVHKAPERALSDGANALHLNRLAGLLARLRAIDALVKGFAEDAHPIRGTA
ncbi:MAG: 3-deoxy-8-phosphooctulonate synthase [Bryobacterales bacterium]|nr:3-deoxy-8-phosphooctulonate synthase [Bryobacterales bacterium]